MSLDTASSCGPGYGSTSSRGVVKSLKTLHLAVLRNAGRMCDVDTTRDEKTLEARFEHEGESFLTITLPTFRVAFERALAEASSAPLLALTAFRRRGKLGLPAFLSGFLVRVFDHGGTLLQTPDIGVIQAVRQITGLLEKLFEVCDPDRELASINGYVVCEEEMADAWYDPGLLRELSLTSAWLFGRPLGAIERLCSRGDLIPRHGPGATAEGISANGKYDIPSWPLRLDQEFPVADYVLAGYSHAGDVLPLISMPEPGAETPVRVISVPKTASKARIIAVEPVSMQYAQQSLLRAFMGQFSGSAPCVNLSTQDRNRELARLGSDTQDLATLDLSEASDRVSVEVVSAVFRSQPQLLAALLASRSQRALVPGHGIITVAKFSSMGSATCFPVESIVFAAIAVNAVRKSLRVPLSAFRGKTYGRRSSDRSRRLKRLNRVIAEQVSVFGDDIIVPTEFVHTILTDLACFSARPNGRKSFWTGRFRESCGGDYYAGEDVTITRLRRRLPGRRSDGDRLVGLIAFRNHMYQRGYWDVARLVDGWLEHLNVPMPIVDETSAVVGRSSVFAWRAQRFHRDYQSPLVKGIMVSNRTPSSTCSEHGQLLKCLLPGRLEPFEDPQHLLRSGRPDAVRTNVRWGSPF